MQSKRDAIIDATKALLWDVGYEAMSPKRILCESGAGQGSLYHHFDGKKHLATVALSEIQSEMNAALNEIFSPDRRPMDRINAFLSKKRDGRRGCRLGRLANETAIADPALRDPVQTHFESVERLIAEALREAKHSGIVARDADTDSLAAAIVAVVQGGYVLSRVHQDPTYIEKATRGAQALLDQATHQ